MFLQPSLYTILKHFPKLCQNETAKIESRALGLFSYRERFRFAEGGLLYSSKFSTGCCGVAVAIFKGIKTPSLLCLSIESQIRKTVTVNRQTIRVFF